MPLTKIKATAADSINTKSASDPAINTNPSAGVGHIWLNTTSGEMYCCTDATADANVWNNVGEGKDNVPVVWIFQGTAYGYSLGGGAAPLEGRTIEKFSLTTDGNGTNVADLSVVMNGGALGYRSATHGYCTAGSQVTINKFEIASDSDGTNVANLHQTRGYAAAGNSETHGYSAGGDYPLTATIDRFDFAAEVDGVDHGDLTVDRWQPSGCSSETHGYASGGGRPGNGQSINVIDKYAFGSNANGTDVGDLVAGRNSGNSNGSASTTHGYLSGAYNANQDAIDKWTFASDNNATDVGNLTQGRGFSGAVSSTTHGYQMGGRVSGVPNYNIRDKWSFTTDGNAVDAGDLAGTQSDFGTIQT